MTAPSPTEGQAPLGDRERFYAPQIDGLRFIAALLVIVHHSPAVQYLGVIKEIGWAGVDLFLCISAFLLTRLIRLEIRNTGNLSVRSFFIRRALRIWPLLFGYAAAATLLGVLYFGISPRLAWGWLLSHLSFSNNVVTAIQGFSPVPFTGQLWTISLEEQAYFVFPFLLLAISRRPLAGKHLLVAVTSLLVVLTVARIALLLAGVSTDSIFVLPTRGDALLLGAAAALYFEDRPLPARSRMLAAAVLLSLPLLLLPHATRDMVVLFIYPVVGIIFACLLLATLAVPPERSWLATRQLRYCGKISYGIYVFHPVCVVAAAAIITKTGVASPIVQLSVTIALTVAVAAISYRFYEAPFLRLKERFAVIASRPV